MKDLKDFLEQYEPSDDLEGYTRAEILEVLERLADVRRHINEAFVLRDGNDRRMELEMWTAQSQAFVVDCVPHILDVLRANHTRKECVTLLDVGSATGAGTALLKSLLSTQMLWCPVEVTGLDIFDTRLVCAKNNFPDFDYVVESVFDHERTYDYVYCSHTVEHVEDPDAFIGRLTELARRNVFVYTPFAEEERIAGHRWHITEAFYDAFTATRFVKIKSPGWYWGKADTDFCLLAILEGSAERGVERP